VEGRAAPPRTGAMTGAKVIGGDRCQIVRQARRLGGRQEARGTAAHRRHDWRKVIAGDRSSCKPCDWADVKTESVSTIEAAGYSYITRFLLRGYVEWMVEEKLADQRKQTSGKTRPPRGGQGAGAKRELAQLQEDAAASAPCDHYGKKHVGECWYKPGTKKKSRAEKKALKAAAELSQTESGEDAGSEVEESDHSHPTRNAYSDTQVEVSVNNRPEHVVRKHSRSAKLQAGTCLRAAAGCLTVVCLDVPKPLGLEIFDVGNHASRHCTHAGLIMGHQT
jgi:hypothetical protein